MRKMKKFYIGYRFHPKDEETYFNPWSIISYLNARRLDRMLLRHGADASAGCRIRWKDLQQPLSAPKIGFLFSFNRGT